MHSGVFGYAAVRNYAPAACAFPPWSHKPSGGKSFTIDALLAKRPEEDVRYPMMHLGARVPAYVYSPNVYYCCPPPPGYTATCRGAFYAQASMSKAGAAALHGLKAKGGKSKRMRTSFTSEQLSRLEKEFARQQYMVGSERFLLAAALQLTEAQVKVWFQNRRIKWRKQSLEQQQAKLAKLGLAGPPPKSPGSQGHEEEDEEEEEDGFSDLDVDVDVSDDSAGHC